MEQYWVFRDHRLEGPYDLDKLASLPGLSAGTSLCRVGEDEWLPARDCAPLRPHLSQELLVKPEWTPVRRPPPATLSRLSVSGDYPPLVLGGPRPAPARKSTSS